MLNYCRYITLILVLNMPIACIYQGCTRTFALQGHLTKHVKSSVHHNGILRDVAQPAPNQPIPNDRNQTPSPLPVTPPPHHDELPQESPHERPRAVPGETFNYHPYLTGEFQIDFAFFTVISITE